VDVAVVGGGPIGIEVAAAVKKAGLSYALFEAKQVGHTMSWWAPGTRWFSSNERISVAGVPLITPDQTKASREQYLAYLRSVVGTHDLLIHPYEPAVEVERDADGLTLITAPRGTRRRTRCRAVVLATGGTDVPRRLGVEGDDLPHVDGYLREPHDYFGRKVLVVGGRNSAVEAALRCHHAGAKVALSYRRAELPGKSIKYWLLPEIEGLLRSGRIASHLGTSVERITPTHVELRDEAGDRQTVEAEVVLSLIGYEQDKRLFRRAGVELVGDAERPHFDPGTMQTNVPGLYVAGTAVAGTQSSTYKIFLENCHVHANRIVAHLTGDAPPSDEASGLPPDMRHLAAEVASAPEA
jgi:thioredoxin reductase (NADPH)